MSLELVSCVSSRRACRLRALVRCFCVVGLLCVAASVRAEPKFMGYFYDGAKPVFSLADADDANARWVELGGKFDGYRIEAFDKDAGKLTLSREGERIEIRLNVARVKDARMEQLERLRALKGIARAQELARTGDAKLGELLKRRQQVLDAPEGDSKNKYALGFLEERIEEVTVKRISELERQVASAPKENAARK